MTEFRMWDEMDRFLRSLSSEDVSLIFEWSERVFDRSERLSGKLDRLFSRLPPLPYDLVVYRGLSDLNWSEVIYDVEHFVATATNAAAAKSFADYNCCYMKIIVPRGAKVLPVSYAHGLTRYPKDMEILLPRQGVFKVVGSETIDIEQHESSMYGPEIAAMLAQMMAARGIVNTYRNEKLFVILQYLPNGRMTRHLAAENLEMLKGIYN